MDIFIPPRVTEAKEGMSMEPVFREFFLLTFTLV